MNKEVNFEIAKLLKDKEFMDKNMYGEVRLSQPKFYDDNGVIHNIKDAFEKTELNLRECYNAPTIAEAVMWLYEKYGIWISVTKDWDVGKCLGFESIIDTNDGFINTETYNSPTEAYEAAIKYTLENLI